MCNNIHNVLVFAMVILINANGGKKEMKDGHHIMPSRDMKLA